MNHTDLNIEMMKHYPKGWKLKFIGPGNLFLGQKLFEHPEITIGVADHEETCYYVSPNREMAENFVLLTKRQREMIEQIPVTIDGGVKPAANKWVSAKLAAKTWIPHEEMLSLADALATQIMNTGKTHCSLPDVINEALNRPEPGTKLKPKPETQPQTENSEMTNQETSMPLPGLRLPTHEELQRSKEMRLEAINKEIAVQTRLAEMKRAEWDQHLKAEEDNSVFSFPRHHAKEAHECFHAAKEHDLSIARLEAQKQLVEREHAFWHNEITNHNKGNQQ